MHKHYISKRLGGPQVPDAHRCVSCSRTTVRRSKQKSVELPHVKCQAGSGAGGRLCAQCFESIPQGTPDNCHVWVNLLKPKAVCCRCSKPLDQWANCVNCERPVCIGCLVPETWSLFCEHGVNSCLCLGCCPASALVKPTGRPSFCILCREEHVDGVSPKCQNPESDHPLLVQSIVQGRVLSEINSRASLSRACASANISVTSVFSSIAEKIVSASHISSKLPSASALPSVSQLSVIRRDSDIALNLCAPSVNANNHGRTSHQPKILATTPTITPIKYQSPPTLPSAMSPMVVNPVTFSMSDPEFQKDPDSLPFHLRAKKPSTSPNKPASIPKLHHVSAPDQTPATQHPLVEETGPLRLGGLLAEGAGVLPSPGAAEYYAAALSATFAPLAKAIQLQSANFSHLESALAKLSDSRSSSASERYSIYVPGPKEKITMVTEDDIRNEFNLLESTAPVLYGDFTSSMRRLESKLDRLTFKHTQPEVANSRQSSGSSEARFCKTCGKEFVPRNQSHFICPPCFTSRKNPKTSTMKKSFKK